MTAPSMAFDTEFGRFYSHPASGVQSAIGITLAMGDGPYAPRPSITNIIRMMDEGFLPGHYAKLVAEHAVDNFGQIQFTATRFGRDMAVGQLKAVPNRPHPNTVIGDEVHAAIDLLHREGVITEDFTSSTSRQMFDRYRDFLDRHQPRVLRSEYTVWSYAHGYAGTGDLLWELGDALWIVDTKTGVRPYPKVAMQNAALANADVILEPNGTEVAMHEAHKLGVLHLRPRSCRLYELEHVNAAWEAFLALKVAFDWMRFHKPLTIPSSPAYE